MLGIFVILVKVKVALKYTFVTVIVIKTLKHIEFYYVIKKLALVGLHYLFSLTHKNNQILNARTDFILPRYGLHISGFLNGLSKYGTKFRDMKASINYVLVHIGFY